MPVNVGDIRKAIEGLPDEAYVTLWQRFGYDSEGIAIIELADSFADHGRLAVVLDVTVCAEEILDDDKDFEDDEDATEF